MNKNLGKDNKSPVSNKDQKQKFPTDESIGTEDKGLVKGQPRKGGIGQSGTSDQTRR